MYSATSSQGKAVVSSDTTGASFDKMWKIHKVSGTGEEFLKDGSNGRCNNVYFNLQRILLTIRFSAYTRTWVSHS